MILQANPNLVRLADAAKKLAPLLDQIAFVGGCVCWIAILTDPAAALVRSTLDVDAIIADTRSYEEFAMALEALAQTRHRQPLLEALRYYRWVNGELILDLMPTDSSNSRL